jgi:diguanylate cyclase (GGDEF)-like protein/PAS domain S-box-containing protein
MTTTSAICLVAFAAYAYVGLSVLAIDRTARSNRLFFVLSVLLSLWALAYAVQQSARSAEEYAAVFRATSAVWLAIPACLLHLALRLTRSPWLERGGSRILAPIYLPAAAFSMRALSSEALMPEILPTPWGWSERFDLRGAEPAAFLAYFSLYGLAAIVLVGRWGASTTGRRERRQATTIVAGGAASLALMALEALGWPGLVRAPVPTVSPLLMAFLVGAFAVALTRYRLMAMSPAAVARILLETMDEAVLLVGPNRVVLTANPAAEALLSASSAGLVGTPLFDWLEPGSGEELLNGLGKDARARVELTARARDGATIPVVASATSLSDAAGEPLGVVLALTDVREAKRTEEELRRIAHHDELTGLTNRPFFFGRLDVALEEGRRQGRRVALLFLDLDDLKLVNDALGHGAGDALLREAARRIRGAVRASDTVSRLGGDEFGVILDDLSDDAEVARVSERIEKACAAPFSVSDYTDTVRYSLGTALFPEDGETANGLLRRADERMYAAKKRKGPRR